VSNGTDALKALVAEFASNHAARPFLAELETRGNRKTLSLHTSRAVASAAQRRDLLAEARRLVDGAEIRVQAHGDKVLYGQKSLEGFARTARGEILFDPTGAVGRAAALTAYAKSLRTVFGRRLEGVFWSGEWRTLYVVFDASRVFVAGKVQTAFLAEAERQARALLVEAAGEAAGDFVGAIRLGFEAPEFPVVPVDAKSEWLNRPWVAAIRRKARMSALGALFGLGAVSTAAAEPMQSVYGPPVPAGLDPAVSAFNGKIAIMGGVIKNGPMTGYTSSSGTTPVIFPGKSEGAFLIEGSLSGPIDHSFGLQIDGALGKSDGDHLMWGVGGHAFWRDPSKGLLGAIASYSTAKQDVSIYISPDDTFFTQYRSVLRIGAEGELYWNMFTLGARGGFQWYQKDSGAGYLGTTVDAKGLFGSVDLTWYATPNFALTVGGAYSEGTGGALTGSFEFQPSQVAMSGLSFFGDGAIGEHSTYRALGGIRYYFGTPTKSLMERHRFDDPVKNLATDGLSGIVPTYYQ